VDVRLKPQVAARSHDLAEQTKTDLVHGPDGVQHKVELLDSQTLRSSLGDFNWLDDVSGL
jgi:hypothetical protein